MAQPFAGETIAAIATAPGPAAVGVIRVSGPRSRELALSLFHSSRPDFSGLKPHRLHHGRLVDAAGRVLDEALVVLMPGPGSFTGEDCVEFQCHGGPAILRAVLDELLARGARLARRGEFSLRAFRNGRIDLAQAEAVAEAIAAPTRAAAQLAQMKLAGALSRRITAVRERLADLSAKVCLAVDFPDEEVECLPPNELRAEALAAVGALEELLAGAERARAWRDGLSVVLAGRVNAGKSSLLNALVGRARAIVSAAPGTTRDYLEEPLNLSGLLVRLIDTAGLRAAGGLDEAEAAGQNAGRELLARADAALYVLDAALPVTEEDRATLDGLDPARMLVVLNKRDLPGAARSLGQMAGAEGMAARFTSARVSAATGEGLENLCAELRTLLLRDVGEPDPDAAAPNTRQAADITRARDELTALAEETTLGLPYDILAQRLDAARRELAGITGEIAPEDVLERIFSKFCIGK